MSDTDSEELGQGFTSRCLPFIMVDPATAQNAVIVEDKYGVPQDFYLSSSERFNNSAVLLNLINQYVSARGKMLTAFGIGLVVGFLLANGKEEMVEEVLNPKDE